MYPKVHLCYKEKVDLYTSFQKFFFILITSDIILLLSVSNYSLDGTFLFLFVLGFFRMLKFVALTDFPHIITYEIELKAHGKNNLSEKYL